MDVVRLTTALRTPEYQYIPALAVPHVGPPQPEAECRSFVSQSQVGAGDWTAFGEKRPSCLRLRPVDPKSVDCLSNSLLVLPVEGAPLVFSTKLAHGMILHVWSKSGKSLDLPAKADAASGGFVVDNHSVKNDELSSEMSGTVRGQWGFESFEGPTFPLRTSRSVEVDALPPLIKARWSWAATTTCICNPMQPHAYRTSPLRTLRQEAQDEQKVVSPNEVQIEMPLKDVTPGPLKMQVKQFGLAKPDEVSLHSTPKPRSWTASSSMPATARACLKGTRLDEVASVELNGIHFTPAGLNRVNNEDELHLTASTTADMSGVSADQKQSAKVSLKDGRTLELAITVIRRAPR